MCYFKNQANSTMITLSEYQAAKLTIFRLAQLKLTGPQLHTLSPFIFSEVQRVGGKL